MSHLYKNSLKQSLLYGIYNDVKTNNNAYYYYIGKSDAWEDEENPPEVINSLSYETSARNNIVLIKKINISDLSFIIPRYDWESGTIFAKHDNTNIDMASQMFYCITSANNVYKCIDNNNNTPSTVQPYATSNSIITTSDGYKWKYMYTVPISTIEQFVTSDYIPVMNGLTEEHYTSGSIYSATINNYGEGYTKNTVLIVEGNGYHANNKLKILNYGLSGSGSGYLLPPIVTVSSPFPIYSPFVLNSDYLLGELIEYNNNIYEVTSAGTSSSIVYPMHTCICSDIVFNGSLSLKFMGKKVSGSVDIKGTTGLEQYELGELKFDGFVGETIIINGGYGYSEDSPPSIDFETPTGIDGISANAIGTAIITNSRISKIDITDHGSNYIDPTINIIIGAPFENSTTFSDYLSVTENDIIEYGNYYYRALNDGTLSDTPPTHETGYVLNGDVSLLMVGEQATAIASTFYGYGYNSNPIINISDPHLYNFSPILFSQDTAIDANKLVYTGNYYYVTNNSGTFGSTDLYTPLDIEFTTDQLNGDVNLTYVKTIKEYVENIECVAGELLYTAELGEEHRFYEVLDTITVSSLPTHVTGTTDNLLYIPVTLPLTYINTELTKAKFFPVIENGQITAAICSDPGMGYTRASITAYESFFGVGTSVDIVPNISKNSTTTKQEYVELSAIAGTIDSIEVTIPGNNYNTPPQVIIQGDGTGCTAVASLVFGSISSIDVITSGQNYTYANIILVRDIADSTNEAVNAEAIAIISPPNGHGSNPITELYANKLAIVANIGNELVNGVNVNNTYRQFGIIKNPLKYNKKLRFNGMLGSSCYSIVCNTYGYIDKTLPLIDINNNEYTILSESVSASNSAQSSMVIHSTSNAKLVLGDILSQTVGQTTANIKILIIKNPDIDKQSGEVLTIDNRESFVSNTEQSITLKTVINI